MKTPIDVKNRAEGRAIRIALDDPQVRAFVLVMGELIPLPSDRARARVLHHVADMLREADELRRTAARAEVAHVEAEHEP